MRRTLCLIIALWLAACGSQSSAENPSTPTPVALSGIFPAANVISGWSPVTEVKVFDRETIFELVDGQADAFFAYGFVQVAVQRYKNTSGIQVIIETWQLATPADAYGLFTANQTGMAIAVGNEGNTDPGRRLTLWQNCFFMAVTASQTIPETDLKAFAKTMTDALPSGGDRPALIARLPATGLEERRFIFFHEEISIQNEIWLGGENILDLSQETNGVVAHYELDGAAARLLLIQYPDASKAAAGMQALQAGGITGLVAVNIRNNMLGAVVGKVDQTAAEALLEEALQK